MKKFLIATLILISGLTLAYAQAQQTALAYYNTAHELAAQGEIAYPVAFIDFSLWNDAVNNAAAAVNLAPNEMTYMRYLGELYTTTQWWSEGYGVWKNFEKQHTMDDQARGWAARTAAKMGYLRLQRNLKQEAIPFLIDSLRWKEDPEIRALLKRAQN
jgi:hypothetical protein